VNYLRIREVGEERENCFFLNF